MADNQIQLPHKLTLNERSHLTMTGVTEVITFDENAVILKTGLGTLVVQGRDLQLKTLSPEGGQVVIAGKITSLTYEEPRPAGFFKGLFG